MKKQGWIKLFYKLFVFITCFVWFTHFVLYSPELTTIFTSLILVLYPLFVFYSYLFDENMTLGGCSIKKEYKELRNIVLFFVLLLYFSGFHVFYV